MIFKVSKDEFTRRDLKKREKREDTGHLKLPSTTSGINLILWLQVINKKIVSLLDRISRRINFFYCLLESVHIGFFYKSMGEKGELTQINTFSEYFLPLCFLIMLSLT